MILSISFMACYPLSILYNMCIMLGNSIYISKAEKKKSDYSISTRKLTSTVNIFEFILK